MNSKEIITLQLGHYSNFIGAHWWNIQEAGFNYSEDSPSEVNHDVLYREGQTSKGQVTFTPRLLLADLKGSLKTLSEQGDLYSLNQKPTVSSVAWPDQHVEIQEQEEHPKNQFQTALTTHQADAIEQIRSTQLKNNINVWSDFLYARFHPRTVNVINEYRHSDKNKPFETFPCGTSLWQNSQLSEDFGDKIRIYVEECDHLQGFHVPLDAIDGFAGLASSCLEHIRDEYDRKSILALASIPSDYSEPGASTSDEKRAETTMKDSVRLVNLALCLDSLAENSSLTVPLCTGTQGWRQPGPKRHFNNVNYDSDSLYHTSAVLATALDTMTMPYRVKSNGGYSLVDLCTDLNRNGRKIAAASLGMPFALRRDEDLIDCLDKWEGPLWQSLTPSCVIGSDRHVQVVTLRGVPARRLKRAPHLAKGQTRMAAYRCESVKQMLELYLSCNSYATISRVTVLERPLPVGTPYPDVFDGCVSLDGDIAGEPRPAGQNVRSVAVLAGCHSGSGVGEMLDRLHREAARVKISRLHHFQAAGLETDDYTECLHRLLDLRECYEDSYDL